MREVKGLEVIECNYRESFWKVNYSEKGYVTDTPIELYEKRRDVDLFHLCGVYGKQNVPVNIDEIDYQKYDELLSYQSVMKQYTELVRDALKEDKAALVSTGYCMYAPAIVGGIQQAIGKDKTIGMVWIDAHADNRIVEEAETTRFVGFPVSTILGQTWEDFRVRDCGLEIPVDGANVVASDIRVCDEPCLRAMIDSNMVHLGTAEFKQPEVWQKAIRELAERVDAIYLSVDMDILHFDYTPSYIKCVPGGHTVEKVMENVRVVMDTDKVAAFSLFCGDFDLYEQNGEWTYLNGMKIIAAGLENWKKLPE